MKKYISILMIVMMLLGCVGCSAQEVVEEAVTNDQTAETVAGDEVVIGQPTADGLVPNGLVAIYLDGDDSRDRLGDFSVTLSQKFSVEYEYQGIGTSDAGHVMSITVLGKSKSLTACMEEIADLAKEAGFNEGECRIEYDMGNPPFKYSEAVMRNMFKNSMVGDGICVDSGTNIDGVKKIASDDRAKQVLERIAQKFGFSPSESTITAEEYKLSTAVPTRISFIGGYSTDQANRSETTAVPAFMRYLPVNVDCESAEGFPSRNSATLKEIIGKELLEEIHQTGRAEAERTLDLGTNHIFQSNWGMVYTDADGDFRVRMSLMVKDPAGKSGWYVTAYEVIVVPVEGDMFTCTEYVATGEIIQLIPYVSFEKSLKCGERRVTETTDYDEGDCGLTAVDVCHAFYINNKIDKIENEFPELLTEHEEKCDSLICSLR